MYLILYPYAAIKTDRKITEYKQSKYNLIFDLYNHKLDMKII